MKRGILFALLFLFLIGIVYAQSDIEQEGLEGDAEKIIDTTDKLRDITEDKENFLAEQWKELLLKNSFVEKMDIFFSKINPVFVFFFARDYGLSIELFWAALMWLFTLIALKNYAILFSAIKEEWQKWAGALTLTVGLAWTQVFNALSGIVFKVAFSGDSWIFAFIGFIIGFFIAFFYFYLNKYFYQALKKAREAREKKDLEFRVRKSEARTKEMMGAAG